MHKLDAQQIIGAWERGRRASSQARALLLAELAGVEAPTELPIGARDVILARQRIATYGARAPAYLVCPGCAEGLEFGVDFERVVELGCRSATEGPWTIERDGFRVRFRLPNTGDLLAMAGDAERARAVLLERIVIAAELVSRPGDRAELVSRPGDRAELVSRPGDRAERDGDRIAPAELPDELVAAIEAEIEQLDPVSDIRFAQTCPTCQERFVAPFDVARFCWHELDVDARRLLQEVDALARIYGWGEAEILAMSRTRRLTYLEMCGVT